MKTGQVLQKSFRSNTKDNHEISVNKSWKKGFYFQLMQWATMEITLWLLIRTQILQMSRSGSE